MYSETGVMTENKSKMITAEKPYQISVNFSLNSVSETLTSQQISPF